MFSLKFLLNPPYGLHEYIWIDEFLIKETPKTLLIVFDGRKVWLPKAWIVKTKFPLPSEELVLRSLGEGGRVRVRGKPISIQISLYHWTKQLQ